MVSGNNTYCTLEVKVRTSNTTPFAESILSDDYADGGLLPHGQLQ